MIWTKWARKPSVDINLVSTMYRQTWKRGPEVNFRVSDADLYRKLRLLSLTNQQPKTKLVSDYPSLKVFSTILFTTKSYTAMFSGFAKVARLFWDFVRVRLIFFSIKSWRICFSSFWAASRFWKENILKSVISNDFKAFFHIHFTWICFGIKVWNFSQMWARAHQCRSRDLARATFSRHCHPLQEESRSYWSEH